MLTLGAQLWLLKSAIWHVHYGSNEQAQELYLYLRWSVSHQRTLVPLLIISSCNSTVMHAAPVSFC
jgi:hypothetical protein